MMFFDIERGGLVNYTNGLKPAGLFISFASAQKKRIKEKGAFAASSSCACFSSHPPSSAVVSSLIASEPSNLTRRITRKSMLATDAAF